VADAQPPPHALLNHVGARKARPAKVWSREAMAMARPMALRAFAVGRSATGRATAVVTAMGS